MFTRFVSKITSNLTSNSLLSLRLFTPSILNQKSFISRSNQALGRKVNHVLSRSPFGGHWSTLPLFPFSLSLILSLLLISPLAAQFNSTSSSKALSQLHPLMSAWQIGEARQKLDLLVHNKAISTDDPLYLFTLGRLLFFESKYNESLKVLEKFQEKMPEMPAHMAQIIGLVRQTQSTLKDMTEQVTEDGRFLIRYFKADALLIPYLIEVLHATDRVLSQDFQYRPNEQIVVEIYPDSEYLAKVSSLTKEEIETSGTIALCNYNRLMFTSPRGLVRGYGWRDTVAHEFVHYYVTKYSANTVPIWLHEGIAKFQEVRWRTEPGRHLAPPQEDLFARSLEKNQLISFDQMHPSMAKLPSQEATSLAFAEVHLVIDFLYQQGGYAQLRTLLQTLKKGADMDGALLESFGFDLSGLWTAWLGAMKQQEFKTYPGLIQRSLKFKRPGQDEEPEGEYDSIEQKEVKDWAHLGELLRARGRLNAALKEYRKAEKKGGDGHLVVQNGIATILLEMQNPLDIPSTLERVLLYYPTFLTTYLNLGKGYVALKEPLRAIEAFEQAIGINPFHPLPHQALIHLYSTTGQTALEERERRILEMMK